MSTRATSFDDDTEDLAVELFYADAVNEHKVWEFVSVIERRYYRSMATDQMREAA